MIHIIPHTKEFLSLFNSLRLDKLVESPPYVVTVYAAPIDYNKNYKSLIDIIEENKNNFFRFDGEINAKQ